MIKTCRHERTPTTAIIVVLIASVVFGSAGCSRSGSEVAVDPAHDLIRSAIVAADAEVFRTEAPLSSDRLRAHVSFLAADGAESPSLAGRFPGTVGIEATEQYIRSRLAAVGAESPPLADDFVHEVTLFASDFDHDRTGVTVRDGELVVAAAYAPLSMRPLPVSDFGTVEAELVFAGYGIAAPEHDWNDYRGIDVDGRIVLVLRYEPGAFDAESGFGGADLTDHSLFATKATAARDRGALGMIVVTGNAHGDEHEDLRTPMALALEPRAIATRWARSRIPGFVAAQIDRRSVDDILAIAGTDLVELQAITDSGAPPSTVDLSGLVARVGVEQAPEPRRVAARNIVGVLRAGSPAQDPEWVVIGAHHDHLGSFGDSAATVYHGADDNASGVAGVIELAAALSTTDRAVNLAFVTFTAEEQGLLGSRAFVDDAVIPPGQIALMINLDMIGRNPDEPVRVYASQAADRFADAIEHAAEVHGLDVSLRRGVVEAVSDHFPFHQAGIAVVSVFTGLHDDYHRVTDTADLLDYDRMERILTVLADALTDQRERRLLETRD